MIFFSGVVHFDFLAGQTVNKKYYLLLLLLFLNIIRLKRPELWATTTLGFCTTKKMKKTILEKVY